MDRPPSLPLWSSVSASVQWEPWTIGQRSKQGAGSCFLGSDPSPVVPGNMILASYPTSEPPFLRCISRVCVGWGGMASPDALGSGEARVPLLWG